MATTEFGFTRNCAATTDEPVNDQPSYLDTKALAQATGLSESFYNQRRVSGTGPVFIRAGRRVLYDWRAVQIWLEQRSRHSTSEPEKDA